MLNNKKNASSKSVYNTREIFKNLYIGNLKTNLNKINGNN